MKNRTVTTVTITQPESLMFQRGAIRIINVHPSFQVMDDKRGNNLAALAHDLGGTQMYYSTLNQQGVDGRYDAQ